MIRVLASVAVVVVGGVVAATRVLGGAGSAPVPEAAHGPSVSPASVRTFGPQVIPGGGPSKPADLVNSLLVTYAPGSACASVQVATPIDKVPQSCGAAWKPFGVKLVPGQDMLRHAPRFPQVSAGPGVSPHDAIEVAVALWRTRTFQAFALATRQLGIDDALGTDHLFPRVGAEELAVEKGDRVTTPLCHFFPTQMRVVALADDLKSFEHRTGRTLGVKARFVGPCYATATDLSGAKHQVFSFNGVDDVVFVGDVGGGDPLGADLDVTGLGDCSADVAKQTCAI